MYKRLKAPLDAQIEVTGLCNHYCQHCYNFWREKNESKLSKNVSLSQENAVDIVRKLGKAEVFNITITGGEPLLNMKACLSCIETAVSMDMGVGMNSNLTLLTSAMAKSLKKAGLNHILTSILGPTPEVHDEITRREGSFERLLKGVKIAHEAGIRISANMVVSQLNFEEIRATAKVVARLGLKSFMATKVGCPGNCSEFSDMALSGAQTVQFLNDLCWIKENLNMKVDTLEPIPLCGMLGVEKPELFMSRKCSAGVTTMTISYDGSVRPCPSLDISYGNLIEEDISDVWSKMEPWSHGFQIPNECKKCPIFPSCGSGCRMEAKTRAGNLNSEDPYMRVDHVKEMAKIIRSLNKQIAVSLPKCVAITKFRLRKEAFGGIMALDKSQSKRVFLDPKGFDVLSQLKPNTVYELPINIDWGGLDSTDFIIGLIQRKVLLCTQK